MIDEDFIQLLKAADNNAFRKLVDEYKDLVYNASLNILQDTNFAEDITQEVFIEVFRSISKFRGDSRLSTWIYRITITKSFEFLRSNKRKKRFGIILNIFSTDGHAEIPEVKTFNHPGVAMENKELTEILFKAIQTLPDNQRSAFTLHHIDGVSYNEIGEILKLSLSSVESLIFRAKKNLKKRLGRYYDEF